MISPCKEIDVIELIKEAELLNLTLVNGIELFSYTQDSIVIGICAIKQSSNKKAYLKFSYVKPNYRGKGILLKMIEYRISILRGRGVVIVIANCMPMSINSHLRSGGKIIKKYKYGGAKIQYEII